ncbi:MAG TPA: trehalose-6-phosphate synthase [Phycisphaerales bacterium]|nr:trehalose-6-phosphate synthase [Phycisphaerales bacterium]
MEPTGSTNPERPLIVVANRLPVRRVRKAGAAAWEISPGGLVTAMHPLLRERGGSWVGWTGAEGGSSRAFEHEGINIHPVPLSRTEIERFYSGFSNETLWPLYHDVLRTPRFHRAWWRTYVDVNRKFADILTPLVGRGETVWIHDYHLQLVPGMIRDRRPDARIGFFLHIPFPAVELYGRMPWRRQILEGLLGADLIGFQDRLMAQNFLRAARRYTPARGVGSVLQYSGREIKALPFPISIDVKEFEDVARSPAVVKKVDELHNRIGRGRKILLGVDRLDYTKGIDVRLRAYEEVLARGQHRTSDMCLIQIAVPSRGGAEDYDEMRRTVEETVGRINGEYAEPGRVAVHYLHRNLQREELVAYYRAADVMLVTPLRDGMNLVAKEYVASRVDGFGVLVLSEFAGAANELRHAVQVNPFDIDGMATAIEQAVAMPARDARQRMRSMRRTVHAYDLYTWASRFMDTLAGTGYA